MNLDGDVVEIENESEQPRPHGFSAVPLRASITVSFMANSYRGARVMTNRL